MKQKKNKKWSFWLAFVLPLVWGGLGAGLSLTGLPFAQALDLPPKVYTPSNGTGSGRKGKNSNKNSQNFQFNGGRAINHNKKDKSLQAQNSIYERDQDAFWAKKILPFMSVLAQKKRNAYGYHISVFKKPQQILEIINEYEKFLYDLKKQLKAKAPQEPLVVHDVAQKPVVLAFALLFSGRGKEDKQHDTGWNGAHPHDNALHEIQILLQKGLLDQHSIVHLKRFVKTYDFENPHLKKEHGFKPSVHVAGDAFKDKVLRELSQAPRAADYLRPSAASSFVPFTQQMLEQGISSDAVAHFMHGTNRIVTDDLQSSQLDHLLFLRHDIAQDVVDVLARIKNKSPMLIGAPGVGKSTLIEIVAQKFLDQSIPQHKAFKKFNKAVVIETSPSQLAVLAHSDLPSAQISALKNYIQLVHGVSKAMDRPIVVFMDNMQNLSKAQARALQSVISNFNGDVHFIGATTNTHFSLMLQYSEAWRRLLQPIQVDELSAESTLELLRQQVPVLEHTYDVQVQPEALEAVLRVASDYAPAILRPEGPHKLLQDVVVAQHKQKAQATVSEKDVYLHVTEKLKLPLNPYDMNTFFSDLEDLRSQMHAQVIDQTKMVDAMVDLWGQMFLGVGRSHRVMLVAGPTGSGKTYAAQVFAKQALGSNKRLLEIDGTKFQNGSYSIHTLLGVPPGVLGYDTSVGVLPEFLEGRGRGVNVILVNELDKASPSFMEALMEMLDTGHLQAPNGKTYYLGRSLVIFTTNKGHEYIYPRRVGQALNRKEIEERVYSITDTQIRQWFMEPDDGSLYNKSKQLDPSVLNRIDRAVPAAPPSREGAVTILQQELARINQDLSQRLKLKVHVDPEVLESFVRLVYQPEDGVRDLNNVLRQKVTQAIQQAHLDNLKNTKNLRLSLQANPGARQKVLLQVHAGRTKKAQASILDGPQQKFNNPLLMASDRDKLKNISQHMQSHIFGQDEAIEHMAKVIRARAINPTDPKPAVMLYLGTTGTGKTQMAKSLAQVLYGHTNRYVQFDLGKVKWEGDLQNIFGSSQGFVGSEKMSAFEKAINNFSEGAVLVFDEIGHMGAQKGLRSGGGNSKDELLKVFYSLLDEGRWTNAHGKTYDLSKFVIVFTSSEGSEQFKNLPTDDLRMAAWQELKSPEKLRALLKRDHNWPEDLLSRIGNRIVLFQPLVEDKRLQVAQKLVLEAVEGLQKQHALQNLLFDNKFYKAVAGSFFSHSQGARAMRDFSQGSLVDLIGEALIQHYDQIEKLQTAKWRFSLSDSYKGLIHYEGPQPPQRKVILSLDISFGRGHRKLHYERDVTGEAVQRRLASQQELKTVALHEAGHAVANVVEHTGQKVAFVTIQSSEGRLGYARYEVSFQKTIANLNREDAVHKIAQILGGREAQLLMNLPTDSGWRGDLASARRLAAQAIASYGLGGGEHTNLSLPLRADGTVNFSNARVQKEIKSLLKEGAEKARQLLEEDKDVLIAVADALLEKKYLKGADFERIKKRVKKNRKQSGSSDMAHNNQAQQMLSENADTASVLQKNTINKAGYSSQSTRTASCVDYLTGTLSL